MGMYQLETTHPLHENPDRFFDPTVAGALVNVGNAYRVALIVVDDGIWLLDSQKPRPVQHYRDAYPIPRI